MLKFLKLDVPENSERLKNILVAAVASNPVLKVLHTNVEYSETGPFKIEVYYDEDAQEVIHQKIMHFGFYIVAALQVGLDELEAKWQEENERKDCPDPDFDKKQEALIAKNRELLTKVLQNFKKY